MVSCTNCRAGGQGHEGDQEEQGRGFQEVRQVNTKPLSLGDGQSKVVALPASVGLRMDGQAARRTKRSNPDFLNGVPELLILSLLSRRSMYGYELIQAIRQATNGTLEFGEGCVYPVLHHLEADGMLASKRETVAGRSRVIYRVTGKGSKRLAATVTTWQQIVQSVNHALQGGEHGQPALAR